MPYMSDELREELRSETNVRKEEKYHAVYWIPRDQVSEYFTYGKPQSAIARILGKELAKETWSMNEEEAVEMDVRTETEENPKKDVWQVSVYIEG